MRRIGKIFKYIFLTLLAICVIWAVLNWSLLSYALNQARGQFHIIWNAHPVENFLNDPQFPDSLKAKLKLIQDVRRFAIDSLGLKDTKNYKTMYDQQGKEVMWVVTASKEFALEPKEWDFPILGSVPYKGFFEEEKAIALKDELDKEGWDVIVRNPGGWSTLGWFTDPILSGMLKRSEGDLASLIIHEMVHGTIFVKDSIDFNENLASFIGDRGAEEFLAAKYGRASEQYKTYVGEDSDYMKFVDHVLRGTTALDSLYRSMDDDDPRNEKVTRKRQMIEQIVSTMDTLSLVTSRKASERFKGKLPNNAYFMSFIHYQSSQDVLWEEWQQTFDGDLKAYIKYLSEKHPFL